MSTWLVTVGLIIVAILVLIPTVLIGNVVYGIITSWIEHRRAEARRVTVTVPGLGQFSTTDNALWYGEVRGLQVSVISEGHPPTQTHADEVMAVMDQLPGLMSRIRSHLSEHEDMSWLEGGAEGFEPFGVDVKSATHFVIDSMHPSDPDGMYFVEFRDGVIIASGRDD